MKKKGFCFKRAVSLFLAAVMIVTAAPQTSLTALAAEQGMTTDTPDVSEGLDILTTEDGTSVETGDTEPSKSEGAAGQDGTDASGDIGDENADVPSDNDEGVGDDEQTGDPDNADQPDNADDPDGVNQGDDAGDSDETADPEEGMDEDLTTDDESVSGNDLEGVMSVFGDETEEVAKLEYVGDIREETDNGISYRRLIIDEATAKGAQVEIADILTYHANQIKAGKCEKFNCVEINRNYDSPIMKAADINGAISVMDTDNCWIDYNFWIDNANAGVLYSLSRPEKVQEDITASCEVELMPNQGVKINLTTTDIPAESVGVSYSKDAKNAFADCWGEVGQDDLRLLALDKGAASSVIEQNGIRCEEYTYQVENGEAVVGSIFGMSIEGIQAGQDYLITPLYWDADPVPTSTTKTLTAGERSGSTNGEGVSDVTWKSLDEKLITIAPGTGATTTLTAKDEVGEAYYCVTYQSENDKYLELRAVRTAATVGGKVLSYVGEIHEEEMEGGENDKTPYRRLLINEYEAKEKNGDAATIADILKYYEGRIANKKCEKFNCVELNMVDDSTANSFSYLMKAENINGARSIMDTGNDQIGYWIDYNFWNETEQATMCYTLFRPDNVNDDIDATLTVDLIAHQGVKINAKTTDFPAEFFGVSYNKNKPDAFAECWDRVGQEDLRLLALDEGVSPGVTVPNGIWYDEYTYPGEDGEEAVGSNFGMEIAGIQAGKDYLITPVYADEDVAKGSERNLTAGARSGSPDGTGVTEVTWKSLDGERITIAPATGATTKLTATDKMGEAYYYVTYNSGGENWLELHSIRVAYAVSDGTLEYIGEVIEDCFEDENENGELNRVPYLRLVINEAEALEQNKDNNITPILEFWNGKGLKVNCVQFDMMDESPSQRKVKKDYINDALLVMNKNNTEGKEVGRWIDYNFWNEETETGVNFTLGSPYEAAKDVNATFTLTDLANKGLKVKFADTAFPAESVSLSYNQPGVKYTDSLPLNDKPFRLFTHSSGTPKAMVDINEEQGWGYYSHSEGEDAGTDIHFNNIKPLGTTEYLAASIYEDEEIPFVGGDPIQLTAGKRAEVSASSATSAAWKLFDTDKATIDKNGKLTAWSDQDPIYYYVTYKVGSAQYLEVHEINAQSQDVKIFFDEDNITMEMNTDPDPNAEPARKFLRLRFYPSDAECDTHDPNQIKWEITSNGNPNKPIIDFVYRDNDDNEVKWDEESGELPEGAAPNGEIMALSEGEATVEVSYLGEEVEDENGEMKKPVLATATCTVNVVKPITWEDKKDEIDAMNLYAVTDLDTKLSDVKLNPGWKWEDPDTSLANFKGMAWHRFPAVYTDENDSTKTFNTSLGVRFVTVTGIEIGSKNENKEENKGPDWYDDWVPDSIGKGETVTLGYFYRMDNLDGSNEEIWQNEYDAVKERMDKNYQIEWTSNPANAGTTASGTYQFTAPTSINKATKYTFTVSVKDKKNKVILKNSCAVTVTVNSLFDWDKVEGPWPEEVGSQMWLNYKVRMPKADYDKQPLTIVSEDTAILKLTGKAETKQEQDEVPEESGAMDMVTYVRIPCKNLKPGTAWIKVTASDDMKSVKRYPLEFIDKEPKLNVSAVTINQALKDMSAEVTVRTHMQYPIDTGNVTLQLNGNATNDITADVTDTTTIGSEDDKDNSYFDYNIKLTLKENASVKKKNTVTLNLVVNPADGAGTKAALETYSLKLTLNVTKTVPKVTFKQAKKVNLFYTNDEGYGILNVTGTDIQALELTGCDFALEQKMVEVDQESESESESEPGPKFEPVPGVYYIKPVKKGDVSKKKGTLSYEIDGYSGPIETNFTVSVENKKPTIVLSQKSDILYPMAGYENSWLRMTDKATGEEIVPSKVIYVINKKKNETKELTPNISNDEIDWAGHEGEWNIEDKKDYNMIATKEGAVLFRLLAPKDNAGYKKKTDKFSLEIKKDNWTSAIPVSYSIKVDTAKPKLVLGKSTLTLNKNDAVYRAQQERTSLHLKGTSDAVYQNEDNWVRFDGQDEKSREILRKNNSLVLQYWDDPGAVIVRFNDNSMAPGTYKFKVSVGNDWVGLVASTVLTVKIVDVSIDKTLKVTAKGSIDVMNREGTSIAYTPKISSISGRVVEGRLEQCMDRDRFVDDWDGSKLIVKAGYAETFNTKYTYRVRAVFEVETEDYERLTVYKDLSIKVKQGKTKLTASTAGNTIYRQLDNTVDIKLSAMLNKQEVNIEDVRLLNFTDDFKLKGIPVTFEDENGETKTEDWRYDPYTKSVRLGLCDRYDAHDVIKSGKTYKVKLAVRYCDQAGNEKEGQVTCSIIVR